VWDIFSSLRLTIFLLILLAATSVLGTIILQNGTPQQYLAEYGPRLSRILGFFGLFDMYHSWWFRAILVVLALNVVFCSLKRLPSVWRQVFHPRVEMNPEHIQAQPFKRSFQVVEEKADLEDELERGIHRAFGKPVRKEDSRQDVLYFEKGRYGRLGVYLAHLSLIVILVGGMIGSVFGFRGVVSILEGQTVDHALLSRNGRSIAYPLGYQVRCDDFDISYYDSPGPEKFVSEYTSTLSILEQGQEVRREKVRVNHPMRHRGLRFYQSSYGNEAELLLEVRQKGGGVSQEFRVSRGERVNIPGHDLVLQFLGYFPEVHDFGEGVQLLILRKDQAPRRIWLFKEMPDYDKKRGGILVFTLKDIFKKDFTVLQVTKEPGTWVVWVGCALLMVGIIMAFFVPHRRVWLYVSRGEKGDATEVLLGGNSHRNRVGFEREFGEIIERLERVGLRAT